MVAVNPVPKCTGHTKSLLSFQGSFCFDILMYTRGEPLQMVCTFLAVCLSENISYTKKKPPRLNGWFFGGCD